MEKEHLKKDPEKAEEIAGDIIDEAIRKELSASAMGSLIASKLAGPKRRNRAEIREIRFGDVKGQLKLAGDKSTINLDFKGLSDEQFDRCVAAIETALVKSPVAG